jgi:hypothetical protein
MKHITGGFAAVPAIADCVVDVPVRMDDFSDDDGGMMYGKSVTKSHDINTGKKIDKNVYNDDGCLVKAVHWDDGKRLVSTFDGLCSHGGYDSKTGMFIPMRQSSQID